MFPPDHPALKRTPLDLRNLCLHASVRYVVLPMIFGNRPDRRRRRRQLLNTSVQVFTESAHFEAIGINVTDVGMCMFMMANLPVGSRIDIEFVAPECLYAARFSAIVRHRAVYLYGIEFVLANGTPGVERLASEHTGNAPHAS